jgi:hypothetical protein
MNPLHTPRIIALTAGIAASLLAGCTHTIKPPAQPFAGYAPQDKIKLKVGLNLTPELRAAKWERSSMGDKWVIPIGPSLCQNSETLARHVFSEVVTFSQPAAGQQPAVDAILTPKVAYINRTMGATSFGKSIVSVKVEWNFADPKGNPIWVDTISGESSGSTGWTNPEKVLKAALVDLPIKSHAALSSAEAIRAYAQRQR